MRKFLVTKNKEGVLLQQVHDMRDDPTMKIVSEYSSFQLNDGDVVKVEQMKDGKVFFDKIES